MKSPIRESLSLWSIAAFVGIVGLFLFVGEKAGIQGMGLVALVAGFIQIAKRRIPYGWEGREPSGYITGMPAVALGVLMCILALAMLARPELMLVLFGENK